MNSLKNVAKFECLEITVKKWKWWIGVKLNSAALNSEMYLIELIQYRFTWWAFLNPVFASWIQRLNCQLFNQLINWTSWRGVTYQKGKRFFPKLGAEAEFSLVVNLFYVVLDSLAVHVESIYSTNQATPYLV
jgi:hypothetical protein